MTLINGQSRVPGLWAIAPVLGAVLLIASGSNAWINKIVLSHPLMVWIGLISFPLYLWHWPLLSFAHMLYPTSPPRLVILSMVGLSFILAWLTFAYVERPLRQLSTVSRRVGGLSFAMVVLGMFGLIVWRMDGIDGRFPPQINDLAAYTYDYRSPYRESECFLRSDQQAAAFGPCIEGKQTGSGQLILLWGDSHAAHLYPGLHANLGAQNRLAQFTSHGCAPIMNRDFDNRPTCRATNQYIYEWVRRNHPDVVLLAAEWVDYDVSMIANTIGALRTLPHPPHIVVVGQVPLWDGGLPRILLTNSRRASFDELVPARLKDGLSADAVATERRLIRVTATLNVSYVSLLKVLCDQAGCLTRTGKGVDSLTAWDYGHLTTAGSDFVGPRILASIARRTQNPAVDFSSSVPSNP